MDLAIEGGFADSVLGAQGVFRAVMEALSRPGLPRPLLHAAVPPAPLTPGLGAVALTLCDHDSTVWLDPSLAAAPAVGEWLRFHTGAPLVADPARAQFALVADPASLPALGAFAQGTDEYPDRSTTIILAATASARGVRLTGPGIRDRLDTTLPLPGPDFLAQWADNRARFPRGIDLLLVSDKMVIGLPRTTRIGEA
jgi:alpha-D-ribose 1-methylphosphonate 5-triphosphate synthase subunit PhnH